MEWTGGVLRISLADARGSEAVRRRRHDVVGGTVPAHEKLTRQWHIDHGWSQ
jgi:hypothetical protein